MSKSTQFIWQKVPLFRVLWPFIAGIILGIFAPSFVGLYVAISALFFGILVGARQWKKAFVYPFSIVPVFIAAGYAITIVNTDRLFPGHYSEYSLDRDVIFIGTLSSDAIPRQKSVKAEMSLSSVCLSGDTVPVHGEVLIYFQKDSAAPFLGINDELAVTGYLNEISPPQNPNEFNYKRYMGFHQITHQIYVPGGNWKMIETGKGLIRMVKDWQHKVLSIVEAQGINDRELAIVSALLVGYKHHLSADQVNAFASAGAMHVLAVSGLHVGIIFLIVSSLLSPLNRIRYGPYIRGVLLLLSLWLYAAVTGLSPSVTRAATMFSFVIAAQQFKRHTNIFNTLATSAMVLLIWNPFLIVEVGFQLSYLAVIGIVVLQPYIYQLWEPKWWLMDKIWAITAVSVSAQVATFPLGLLYFHQFPNYFLLSNLVVIPAATAILPVGIALITFHWIPHLVDWFGRLLYWLVHLLDLFIQWVEKLPGALVSGIDISIFETYFIYMIILTSVMFVIHRQYKWLMAFLVSISAIEVFNIGEAYIQQNQKAMVFYSVRGHAAIDVIDGVANEFYADTSLINDFDKMRFHIHHHWWARDLSKTSFHDWKPGYNFGLGKNILILDDSVIVGEDIPVDILYLNARTQQHPKSILEMLDPELVVISPNMDWKTKSYWLGLLEEQGIEVHDLRREGALVYSSI